jgi:hypothetical protein
MTAEHSRNALLPVDMLDNHRHYSTLDIAIQLNSYIFMMTTIKKSLPAERRLTTTITISVSDQEYLNRTVATLKRGLPKTNRSELVALGLALLRQNSLHEIEKLLGRQ